MSRRIWRIAALAALGALALGACSSGGDDSSDGGSSDKEPVPVEDAVDETGQTEVAIAAQDNMFKPQTITVDPGTTITWDNGGRNDHNILDASEGWTDATPTPFEVETDAFAPGDEYSFTVEEPGTYAYFCSLHGTETGGMIGTVVVAEG